MGSRFQSGQLAPKNTVVFAIRDLTYTVGFERGAAVVDDAGALGHRDVARVLSRLRKV